MNEPNPVEQPPAVDRPMTVYILSYCFSGLRDMIESQRWEKLAGVPLVPMYWLGLAERGHRVHVFVNGDFSSEADFVLKGIHFHRRRIPGWALSGTHKKRYMSYLKFAFLINWWKLFRSVQSVAKTDPPDVLYSYHSGCAYPAHVLSRRFGVPHVMHMWGTWLGQLLFQGPWHKRLIELGSILMIKYMPLDLFIMSNDGTLGDKVAEKLAFPKERFRFWLDGTSPEVYKPDLDRGEVKRSLGLQPSDKMIFQVARLDGWKRIDRMIDAMPTILGRVPNAHLVVAGDGHLRQSLEQQIAMLGVGDHVKLLGQVPNDRVRVLHNAADLFVTVQDLTNLGNQIQEAMHSGTCVVAYDIGGTRDVMVDGVTGVLLAEQDLPRLGEVVADLLLDDERRERLARGALEHARKHIWFWNERIEAEIDEIRRLVARKPRARADRRSLQPTATT